VCLPIAIRLLVRWSLLAQVVALEDREARGALRSSGRIVGGRWPRAASITLALSGTGLLLGPVVVNLSAGTGPGSWVFYHPLELFLEAVALSLLVSLLTVSAGVLISLHAATVRQAQQTLIIGTIVLIFGGLLALSVLPADLFSAWTYPQLLLIAMAVLALLDAVLLGLALVSFQRSRLILS